MKFRYAPEGPEPREWPFQPGKMSSTDAIDIEARTGLAFRDWERSMFNGSILATKALLFCLLRRDNPSLVWDQLEFLAGDCSLFWDDDDLKRLDERAAAGTLSLVELEMREAVRVALKADAPAKPEPEADDASDPTQPPTEPGELRKKQRDRSGSA